MARKKPHEDHVNHEAWAIPYGDLITLLLAFFVVMYAVSSVNEGKYRVAAASMSAAFGGTPKSPMPIQVGDHFAKGDGGDKAAVPVNAPAHAAEGRDMRLRAALSKPIGDVRPMPMQPDVPTAAAELQMQEIAREIIEALAPLIDDETVRVIRKTWWLEIEINTDLLFASGSAALNRDIEPVIDTVGEILAGFDNRVRVEGHTDNRPINTHAFPSNWELSAARASTVVRRLQARGLVPQRLSVIGHGEFHPIDDNARPEGRQRNRRVTLIVLAAEMTGDDEPPGESP